MTENQSNQTTPTLDDVAACLLGGALGDALGWPIEFLSIETIKSRYGPTGITQPDPSRSGHYEITDDTQMTLFTAEGLLRAAVRYAGKGICHPPSVVLGAYRRWLRTQTESFPGSAAFEFEDGWLVREPRLWARRAPGNTCLSALSAAEKGQVRAHNTSKGCGTVMKTAPVGLFAAEPFQLACEIAALTHGHRTAQIAAGFLSEVISNLAHGHDLPGAIERTVPLIKRVPDHHEVLSAVNRAVRLADSRQSGPDAIHSLGGGWVAEEAVAIGLFSALRAEGFEDGVRLAVNHSGDSDSTGAIAGNLLGMMFGLDGLPERWLRHLELRNVIERIAADLCDAAGGGIPSVSHHGMSVVKPGVPIDPAEETTASNRQQREDAVYDRWSEQYPGC